MTPEHVAYLTFWTFMFMVLVYCTVLNILGIVRIVRKWVSEYRWHRECQRIYRLVEAERQREAGK